MFHCNKNYGSQEIRLNDIKRRREKKKTTFSSKDKDWRRNLKKDSHVLLTIRFADVDMLKQEI